MPTIQRRFTGRGDVIWLSVVLIVTILVCLVLISGMLRTANLTVRQRWLVGVPFSVYFGWTTVATVANVTVLLVSLSWDGFRPLRPDVGGDHGVVVAMAIGTVTMGAAGQLQPDGPTHRFERRGYSRRWHSRAGHRT